MNNRTDGVPKLTAAERQDVYRRLFQLNRSFSSIVERLDELRPFLKAQDLKDMQGLTQEIQLEINTTLLNKLESIEERDWAHFGKVRARMERRLKKPV